MQGDSFWCGITEQPVDDAVRLHGVALEDELTGAKAAATATTDWRV